MALSALFQAAELVSTLAKNGKVSVDDITPLMDSILKISVDQPEDVYGGNENWKHNLFLGRQVCLSAIDKVHTGQGKNIDPNTLRYALSILHLEAKLSKNTQMLSTIGQRIQQLLRQKDHFGDTMHQNMLAAMSGVYQDTLSKLTFRIQVHGNSQYLQQSQVSDQVRACLLAGVRAALLWRQLGGRRWHLLLKRKSILQTLTQLNS